jgi:hypothetical protein
MPEMHKSPTEARFAVGSRNGARSSIWKAWVHGNEAYIASRMFGGYMKVSFHSTGQCQWSRTDKWVVSQRADVRNAKRHVVKWLIEQPLGNETLLVLRIAVPVSDLNVHPPTDDSKKVHWIAGAPIESTVEFLVYLTGPMDVGPLPTLDSEKRHLFSLHLNNRRWLVVFVHLTSLSAVDVDEARRAAVKQIEDSTLELTEDARLCFFAKPADSGSACGLLEVRAIE